MKIRLFWVCEMGVHGLSSFLLLWASLREFIRKTCVGTVWAQIETRPRETGLWDSATIRIASEDLSPGSVP